MKRPSLFTSGFNPFLILITLIGLIAGLFYFKNNSNKFGLYVCNGRFMTAAQVADFRGITLETAQLISVQRSLSVEDICIMPQAKLERAILRANNPKPDHPSEAVEFRKLQMMDENGYIPPDGLVRANSQIQQMLAAQNADIDSNAAGIAPGAWSWLGPGNIGGRVRAIVIHPTNPNILWAGSVSGGIWKSTDAGASWQILTDFLGNMAVSALVMDPNNPNVIYAGTGEGFYNGDGLQGAGVFKTTDGGATWTQLSATITADWYYVNRLAIASNGTTLLAATGSGIWRSTNAGANWTQVLINQPVKDINFDPTDNNKAIASGSDGKAWYSTNGGASWTAASGLPALDWLGRVEVAYAPSNPTIVYASIPQNNGELWKSTNGGQSYSLVNAGNNYLGGQGWYDNIIWVDPTNPNILLVGGIDIWRSTDGGANLTKVSLWWAAPDSAHADNHMILEDPGFDGVNNKRVYIGNDGGVYRADDAYGVSQLDGWTELNNNLGVTQFYGAAGNAGTGEIIGGTQDNGTLFYTSAGGTEGWETTFGGDGGWSQADPTDPDYFYGEYVNLQLHRSTDRGLSASYIDDGLADAGACANFISPFMLDPNNPNTMLAGGCSLWRSANIKAAIPTWASIKSPTVEKISAIAIAQGNSNIIWVGHNNGDVYKTINGASASPTWTKMDANSPALPGRYVTRITIDNNDNNKVYVTFGSFSVDNVWRTTNGGTNWTDITGSGGTGLPSLPVRSLVINPNNSNWLYVGTELGIFASPDGGVNWTVPHDGPTNTSVDELFWMNSALVAATHGRGLFKIETLPCVTLTTTSNPLAGGSVSADPAPNCVGDSTKYSQGAVVTLTATANSGYAFSSWGGDASGTVTSVDITMSADKTATANFAPICFTLTMNSNPVEGGTVDASPAPNCVGDPSRYSVGTVVSLTATPNTGFSFSSWSGDAGGSINPATVTMSTDRSVAASFVQSCFTLTINANPVEGGTVNANPAPNCVGDPSRYSVGTLVTLTVSTNAGYNFSNWSGDASGTTPSVDVSISADKSVTANFSQVCYTLIASANPLAGGTVDANPAPNCNGTQYTPGTTVSLTANANTGYAFASWSGDASGLTSPVDVTMAADKTVTANFDPTCYTLTMNINPPGSGTVDANPTPNCNGTQYTPGTIVSLTASASAGYVFASWSGDASGVISPVDVTMSADRTVTANFDPTCFTLTTNANPTSGGTINENPAPNCVGAPTKYSSGTVVTLTANANAGYAFASWSGDASGITSPVDVTMSADRTVAANFDPTCFTLTTNTNPASSGTVNANPAPNCVGVPTKYSSGTVVTLTANANAGYAFASWSGDASGTISPVDVTMSADRTVTANFSSTCFTLTANANPTSGGTINANPAPNCNGTKYTPGTIVSLTASANSGYTFGSWSGDASGTTNPVNVTMTADKSVVANFTQNCYTLTTNASPASGGTVNANPAPNCAGAPTKYSSGTVVTLTANANPGYVFGYWNGSASGFTSPVNVTMSADKSVTANFIQTCYTLTTGSNPTAGGAVDASPAPNCAGAPTKYSSGTVVTLTASANAGYTFASWSGGASGTTNPVNITMSADQSVTANFSPACYSLLTSSSPVAGGSVIVSPAPNCVNDPAKYSAGTVLTLTANANVGYGFASWSGDASGTINPVDVTLTADQSVTANFTPACFTLTSNANPAAGGSVNANPAPNCAGVPTKYSAGTVVSLTAAANTGYSFSSWSGDASGTTNPVNVTMSADKSVTANFSEACYTLIKASNPIGGGTVAANPAPNCNSGTQYTHGTVVSLTATANADYVFSSWSSDASGSINPTTVTMLADKGVIANFTNATSPVVTGITRLDANPTSATRVKFVVTFSKSVTGVDTHDFALTTYGLNEAWVGSVSGMDQTYTVTVNTGTGNGTIRLDVADNDTIKDLTGISLGGAGTGNGNYTSGPSYTVVKGATYVDVPFDHWAWQYVERLHNAGVTSGCWTNPPYYCPNVSVNRAQMAVFLLRAKYGSAYIPPAAQGNVYEDVPATYWAAAWIEQLASEGITAGCGSGNYCPETPITRGQMAVFLLRAKHGSAYTPPPAIGVFADVPTGHWAAAWIEQLAAEGITSGCGGSNYCPDAIVGRAQMAVFLVKAFSLP